MFDKFLPKIKAQYQSMTAGNPDLSAFLKNFDNLIHHHMSKKSKIDRANFGQPEQTKLFPVYVMYRLIDRKDIVNKMLRFYMTVEVPASFADLKQTIEVIVRKERVSSDFSTAATDTADDP